MFATRVVLVQLAVLMAGVTALDLAAEELEEKRGRPGTEEAEKNAAAEVRLAIAHDGLILIREDKPFERFLNLADFVRAYPGLAGAFMVEIAAATKEPGAAAREAGEPEDNKATRVKISAGDIAVAEFLRYLADTSGLPVICESTDKSIAEKTIHIVAPIENANEALVRRLLEANRVRVTEAATGAEGRVLIVEPMDAPIGSVEPRPVPIVQIRSFGEAGQEHEAPPPRRRARGPEGGPADFAGVALEDVPEMLQAQLDLAPGEGVFVASVDAARAKSSRVLALLTRFDVVTHVADVKVGTPMKLVEVINAIPSGLGFQLRVVRRGVTTIVKAVK